MKNSVLQAVLAIGILKFTDINEGFLCKIEAKKIKNEVNKNDTFINIPIDCRNLEHGFVNLFGKVCRC